MTTPRFHTCPAIIRRITYAIAKVHRVFVDLGDGGGHHPEADHADEHHPELQAVGGDVAVHRHARPRHPEGDEEQQPHPEAAVIGLAAQHVRELGDAGNRHQVEEQFDPGGVPDRHLAHTRRLDGHPGSMDRRSNQR